MRNLRGRIERLEEKAGFSREVTIEEYIHLLHTDPDHPRKALFERQVQPLVDRLRKERGIYFPPGHARNVTVEDIYRGD